MVLVKKIDPGERRSKGGIVLPDTAKNPADRGEVLAVGPGLMNEETGKRIPTDVTVGEMVLVPRYAGTEISVFGEKLFLVPAPEIMADVELEDEEREEHRQKCATTARGLAVGGPG